MGVSTLLKWKQKIGLIFSLVFSKKQVDINQIDTHDDIHPRDYIYWINWFTNNWTFLEHFKTWTLDTL
jgi:hypothetical protein